MTNKMTKQNMMDKVTEVIEAHKNLTNQIGNYIARQKFYKTGVDTAPFYRLAEEVQICKNETIELKNRWFKPRNKKDEMLTFFDDVLTMESNLLNSLESTFRHLKETEEAKAQEAAKAQETAQEEQTMEIKQPITATPIKGALQVSKSNPMEVSSLNEATTRYWVRHTMNKAYKTFFVDGDKMRADFTTENGHYIAFDKGLFCDDAKVGVTFYTACDTKALRVVYNLNTDCVERLWRTVNDKEQEITEEQLYNLMRYVTKFINHLISKKEAEAEAAAEAAAKAEAEAKAQEELKEHHAAMDAATQELDRINDEATEFYQVNFYDKKAELKEIELKAFIETNKFQSYIYDVYHNSENIFEDVKKVAEKLEEFKKNLLSLIPVKEETEEENFDSVEKAIEKKSIAVFSELEKSMDEKNTSLVVFHENNREQLFAEKFSTPNGNHIQLCHEFGHGYLEIYFNIEKNSIEYTNDSRTYMAMYQDDIINLLSMAEKFISEME